MELFVASMAIIGLATTITAINEAIDWMPHYRREGEEDFKDREHPCLTYDKFCEEGYRE